MTISRHFLCAIIALLALQSSSSSLLAAPLMIDTFEVPGPWATYDYNPTTPPGVLRTNDTGSSILGQRDTVLGGVGLFNGGDFLGIGTANFGSLNGLGVLDFTTNASSNTSVSLEYDNFPTQDFSSDLGISLNILAYNNGSLLVNNVVMPTESIFTLITASGNLTTLPLTFPNVGPGAQSFLIPFNAFSGTGSLSTVQGITFNFNSNNSFGFDLTLDSLSVLPAPIPEPATLALFGGAGVIALYVARRKRKQSEPVAN